MKKKIKAPYNLDLQMKHADLIVRSIKEKELSYKLKGHLCNALA
jgi:hypothetical protein